MSELAFDKEGNPFRFSRRTKKLRPRRWKNAGQRGTCAAVLDPDGEPVLIDADAEYTEFRAAIGNVPGFYRLDQCDEDGASVEDAPPAYVSIASTRTAAPIREVDPRDAIIRDLAQINADIVRTITERFGTVMQAAADILRAADGAGLPRRESPPSPPPPAVDEDEDDEDEDDEETEPAARSNPFGPLQPLVEMAMPHLPKLGALLWVKLQELMKQSAMPPAAPSSSPPAPEPVAAPAAEPSATPAPSSVPDGASAPDPVPAPTPMAPSSTVPPVPAPAPMVPSSMVPPVPAPTPMVPSSMVSPVPAPGASSTPKPPASAPATVATVATPTPTPLATATNEGSTLEGSAPSTTAMPGAEAAGTAQADGPRNAPSTIEPTPEQWAHWLAVRARLSPRKAAIADTAVARMTPEMRAQWLAELSALGVDHAADTVRSMIPKAPPRTGAASASTSQTAFPGDAPSAAEAPPEQWAHWLAIRARLSPREVAITDIAVARMTPEMRAQWLAELAVLGVDHAADVVRSIIPEAPPKAPDDAGNGGGCS